MSKRTARSVVDPKEAFFSRLPAGRFTKYEDEVLHALQLLSDVMSKWFPRSVSLQEWAERRIPPHLASSVNGSGIVFVKCDHSDVEQDAPETENTIVQDYKRRRTEVIEKTSEGCGRKLLGQHAQQQRSDSAYLGEKAASYETQTRLHENADEFLYEEIILREIIFQAGADCLSFAQLMRLPRFNESFMLAQTALQRKYHDIMDWAEDRAAKWFIVERGHDVTTISTKAPSEEERKERNEELEMLRERFFNTLPENRFSPEEDALREAILNYVDRWTGRLCVYYTKLCEDPTVRNARYICIPPTISLMEWCETRMGQEVQFEKVENGHLITRVQQDSASL